MTFIIGGSETEMFRFGRTEDFVFCCIRNVFGVALNLTLLYPLAHVAQTGNNGTRSSSVAQSFPKNNSYALCE